jgi:hypothetical protein
MDITSWTRWANRKAGIMKSFVLSSLLIITPLILTACARTESLPFQVLQRTVFIDLGATEDRLSGFFVISSEAEIGPRFVGYELFPGTSQILEETDFESSFLVFILVGQIRDNGRVVGVLRKGGEVTIQLDSYRIGPGNYEIPGYTMPYKIVEIAKGGRWGRKIEFTAQVLSGEGEGMIWQTRHFIP